MTKITAPIKTSLRLPPELHEQAVAAASECDRTLNNFIVQAVRNELKRGNWLDRSIDDGK